MGHKSAVRGLTIASIVVLTLGILVWIAIVAFSLWTILTLMDVPYGFAYYGLEMAEASPRLSSHIATLSPAIQGMLYAFSTLLGGVFSLSMSTAVLILTIYQMQKLGASYDPAGALRYATAGGIISAIGGGLVPAILLAVAAWKLSDDKERQHIARSGTNSYLWSIAGWFNFIVRGHDDAIHTKEAKYDSMVSKLCAPLAVSVPALFLGPIYWAYRKRYKGAWLLLGLAFLMMALNLLIGEEMFGAVGPTLSAVLFYRAYRAHALSVLRTGAALQWKGKGIEGYLQDRGGVSPLAAVGFASLLIVGIVILAQCSAVIWS